MKGKIPASVRHEDDLALAFDDINPQAPIHILVIPKKHIPTVADVAGEDEELIGHLIRIARKLATERDLPGYKLLSMWARQAVKLSHMFICICWEENLSDLFSE